MTNRKQNEDIVIAKPIPPQPTDPPQQLNKGGRPRGCRVCEMPLDTRRQIVADHLAGKSLRVIAKKLGVSHSVVQRHIRECEPSNIHAQNQDQNVAVCWASILDDLAAVSNELWEQFLASETMHDGLNILDRMLLVIERRAKIAGNLMRAETDQIGLALRAVSEAFSRENPSKAPQVLAEVLCHLPAAQNSLARTCDSRLNKEDNCMLDTRDFQLSMEIENRVFCVLAQVSIIPELSILSARVKVDAANSTALLAKLYDELVQARTHQTHEASVWADEVLSGDPQSANGPLGKFFRKRAQEISEYCQSQLQPPRAAEKQRENVDLPNW